ncbi:hypothetical protein CB1_000079008 [Camelus ferus]|nr:hypothetical protein CB1_000079008 [Camelus ferus]
MGAGRVPHRLAQTMIQGASEADGPSWGWDGDGDDDWDGAVLTLLALAVVAATALALHWFGSGQDQEAAGPASTAPRTQTSQVGGTGPALPPKSKSHNAQGPLMATCTDPGWACTIPCYKACPPAVETQHVRNIREL